MIERPIVFSTEMVKAIFEGRKTQTRRLIKPQPEIVDKEPRFIKNTWAFYHNTIKKYQNGLIVESSPYGKIKDLLYVRETWAEYHGGIIYKADQKYNDIVDGDLIRWKPSIHMPKKYARLWLKVKNIRVESLQDITEEDVRAEGIKQECGCTACICRGLKRDFEDLWNSINEKRGYGWDTNPWVWVIVFAREFLDN